MWGGDADSTSVRPLNRPGQRMSRKDAHPCRCPLDLFALSNVNGRQSSLPVEDKPTARGCPSRLTGSPVLFNFNAFNNACSVAILKTNRLEELLGDLGCQLNQRGSYGGAAYEGPCPVHGGHGPRNFHVGINGESLPVWWRCWSHHCDATYKRTLLGLVRGVLSFQRGRPEPVNAMEAVKFLRKFVGDDLDSKAVYNPTEKVALPTPIVPAKSVSWPKESIRSRLDIPSPYFVERGFSPIVLDSMSVGYSRKWDCSVVPYFDDSGNTCIGYQTRTHSPKCERCRGYHERNDTCERAQPKWKVSPGFAKQRYLYNFDAVLRADAKTPILLVEGPGDLWRAAEAGILAVSCLGSDLTGGQATKLIGRRVFVMFDNDIAGTKGTVQACSRLAECGVFSSPLGVPGGFQDVGMMSAGELKEMMSRVMAKPPAVSSR